MKIPVSYPFLYCQCKYTLDRYCSICSAIKCPLEITADDYFVTSNGVVYDAIQAAYIVLWILGYLRVSCLPSTIILPAAVCLPICLLCSCDCMCERTTHAQIQEFLPGGVQACLLENHSDVFCFFSPQLILQFLQRVSKGNFKENYNFTRFQRGGGGGATFARGGGGPTFSSGGSKC